MFFSRVLLASVSLAGLVVPAVVGVPAVLSGDAVDVGARASVSEGSDLIAQAGQVLAKTKDLSTATTALAHSNPAAASSVISHIDVLNQMVLPANPITATFTGLSPKSLLTSCLGGADGLTNVLPVVTLLLSLGSPSGQLQHLLGAGSLSGLLSLHGLGGLLSGVLALLDPLLATVVAILDGLVGAVLRGCNQDLVSTVLAAVLALLVSLGTLQSVAAGCNCADSNLGAINSILGLL
ncbi:hypothetical protein C8R47DRAFT_1229903 [Mycena vitilis]|nr:hypothetical protein C8R47DRAFT_1229903 [Mycena vitilis]